jgi:uncharacterized protein
MSLQDQLFEEMKQAMKAHDQLKLDVIRLLRARIKNVEIDQGEQDDTSVQKIVQQMIKQWQDAIIDYKKGERADLVEEAEAKVKLLEAYLPAQLSDDELKKIIEKVKADTGLDQVGPLIGQVKQKVGNQADGRRVAQLVSQFMNS